MMKTLTLSLFVLSILGLCACLNDSEADKVEEITVFVSEETGFYYDLFDDKRENAIEGMLIREKGQTHWNCVHFNTISGFYYEKGKAYELRVKKTTLIDPPQDSSNIRYTLIKITSMTE